MTVLALYDPTPEFLDAVRNQGQGIADFKKRCNAWRDRYLLDDQKRSVVVYKRNGCLKAIGVQVLPGDDTKTRKLADLPFPGWKYIHALGGVDTWIPDSRVAHGVTVEKDAPVLDDLGLDENIHYLTSFQAIEWSQSSETPYVIAIVDLNHALSEEDANEIYGGLYAAGFK